MDVQVRAGEKDVIDSEVRPTIGADIGLGELDRRWVWVRRVCPKTKMSHHHILSAGEGVNGNSQTYLWINAVEFIVDLGIPRVLPVVLNVIRDIVTEVREWNSHVRNWVLESLQLAAMSAFSLLGGWNPKLRM